MVDKIPVRKDRKGEETYKDDTKTERLHKRIAYIITFSILIVLYFYNYWAFDLPYRHKVIHITNDQGAELLLNDIIKEYNKSKNTIIDYNDLVRRDGTIIYGKIKVGKIEQDTGDTYKITSDGSYNQYKKLGWLAKDQAYYDGNESDRNIVMYTDLPKSKILNIRTGDIINFRAKYNNMNNLYLILTEGEIIK